MHFSVSLTRIRCTHDELCTAVSRVWKDMWVDSGVIGHPRHHRISGWKSPHLPLSLTNNKPTVNYLSILYPLGSDLSSYRERSSENKDRILDECYPRLWLSSVRLIVSRRGRMKVYFTDRRWGINHLNSSTNRRVIGEDATQRWCWSKRGFES